MDMNRVINNALQRLYRLRRKNATASLFRRGINKHVMNMITTTDERIAIFSTRPTESLAHRVAFRNVMLPAWSDDLR
jgi:hypothetical protein